MKTFEDLFAELQHKAETRPEGSGTVVELDRGVHFIGKKIVEEAAEVWMAAGSCPAARSRDTSSRLPFDVDIFSPSSPTMPACTYADANGSPVAAVPSAAHISWCGNTRSDPPPCTSNRSPR